MEYYHSRLLTATCSCLNNRLKNIYKKYRLLIRIKEVGKKYTILASKKIIPSLNEAPRYEDVLGSRIIAPVTRASPLDTGE
jgi:hypothetical protein